MVVSILGFGAVKEIFGGDVIAVEISEGVAADDLRNILLLQYPRLNQLTSFMIAVNSEYAQGNTVIVSGDEVALIPPVSGG
jgi:molybdopterin converting factor subunit 1